jgi:hypothetical protein
MKRNMRKVALPVDICKKIEHRIAATDFHSLEEYITFVLEEVLKEEGEEHDQAISEEEEEQVKSRLRALGYLD